MSSLLRCCEMVCPRPIVCAALGLCVATSAAIAQTPQDTTTSRTLKQLSVEELMNVEVTSVSKRPEKLTQTASAIQVITGEDIRRSGATNLPDALRLLTNLQVAQINAHNWGITARGFNGEPFATNTLGDKLLVLIDGRTVYSPLFSGVYWDVQNVMLEDVDRIEVISGPGGTLWGANAVNGVINIITKRAADTQGLYVAATGGSSVQDAAAARYGGTVGPDLSLRVYAQRMDYNSTDSADGGSARDGWNMNQAGFRMEYVPSPASTVTLQGDGYEGDENRPTTTNVNGQDILGRWTRTFSDQSNFQLQMYVDRTWRDTPDIDYGDNLIDAGSARPRTVGRGDAARGRAAGSRVAQLPDRRRSPRLAVPQGRILRRGE
jgi:iron complex outermembrane receptor protein